MPWSTLSDYEGDILSCKEQGLTSTEMQLLAPAQMIYDNSVACVCMPAHGPRGAPA